MSVRMKLVTPLLGILLAAPVVCAPAWSAEPENPLKRQAEGENPLKREPADHENPLARNAGGFTMPDPMVLEPAVMREPVTGMQAGTILIPEGWKLHLDMAWRYDRVGLVANNSRVASPDGAINFRFMQLDALLAWPEGLALARQYGQSPYRNGSLMVARSPDPKQYVLEFALPQRRLGEVEVVEYEEFPKVAKAIEEQIAALRAAGATLDVKVGRTRIAYEVDGKAMEEDVFCSMVYMSSPEIAALGRDSGFAQQGIISVLPERLYSFSAPKGQLDAVRPLGHLVITSARHTVQWDALLMELEAIRAKGEMDRAKIIATMQNEINATVRGVIVERQKAAEKGARAFDGYIRQTYAHGPDGTPHPMPPGKKYGWVGPTGHVIGSNNPNLVPPQGYTMLK